MVVGVTGNYCSGKDVACEEFRTAGFTVIDVDKLGHEALVAKRDQVVEAFGEHILDDGNISRKKLGALVFGDGEKRKRLERIVHPWMIQRVRRLVSSPGLTQARWRYQSAYGCQATGFDGCAAIQRRRLEGLL